MTKEEIIQYEFSDKLDEYIDDTGEYFITQAERCMDQYAKQEAKSFAEWIADNTLARYCDGVWFWLLKSSGQPYTIYQEQNK